MELGNTVVVSFWGVGYCVLFPFYYHPNIEDEIFRTQRAYLLTWEDCGLEDTLKCWQ